MNVRGVSTCLHLSIITFVTFAYEDYRLPRNGRKRYDHDWRGFEMLPPYVNGYGGPVGLRTVLICKVKSEVRPQIAWYRKVADSLTCTDRADVLITDAGTFCRENREKLRVVRNRKYVMKLRIRRPRARDSGLYMCFTSVPDLNVTQTVLLTFHDRDITPVRVRDAIYDNYGEGRVEFLKDRQWISPYFRDWESPEARLFCRLLGFEYGGEPRYPYDSKNAVFSYSYSYRRPDRVVSLECPFNATDVKHCTGWDSSPRQDAPAGVTCRRTPVTEPTKNLRFAGGSPTEGRVEVYYDGLWGTMCKRGFTENEINTICKEMGYSFGGIAYKAWKQFLITTVGVGPIMISGLRCPSNASTLDQCSHSGLGTSCCSCSHNDDLAIRCYVRQDENIQIKPIRLAGYGRLDKGRVEVFRNGSWGLVSAYWFHYPEANMFCKMLGYQYGGTPVYHGEEFVPRGYGHSWIKYIGCPLNASTITDCEVTWIDSSEPTVDFEGGAVLCRTEPMEVPNMPFRVGRRDGREKLQFYKDGYWGTVCGAYIGTPEASAICSMMGHRFGGSFHKSSRDSTYRRFGPILLKYLDCPVNATSIDYCAFREYTDSYYRSACYSFIDHKKDVGINCRDRPFEDIPIRLNGARPNKGVVEIYYEGSWNLVSSQPDPRIVAVLCRQLGFRHGGQTYYAGTCGNPISCNVSRFLSGLSDCTGKEENIGHCNGLTWHGSRSYRPLGIHCYESNETLFEVTVREEQNQTGTVLLKVGDDTFSICANLWDEIHAKAVCAELGYSDGVPKYYVGKSRGLPNQKMIRSMYCDRRVRSLHECYHTGWGNWDDDCFSRRPVRAGVDCIP